jgi:hypothetical protein
MTTRRTWLVPVALIALSLIPIVSGSLRLVELSGGPALVPEASRFTVFPWPVVIHIVSATLLSILGAFQFVEGLRRRRRGHRVAGRLLIPAGFLVALSGMWMAVVESTPRGNRLASPQY